LAASTTIPGKVSHTGVDEILRRKAALAHHIGGDGTEKFYHLRQMIFFRRPSTVWVLLAIEENVPLKQLKYLTSSMSF
jgi:hypothetical protein